MSAKSSRGKARLRLPCASQQTEGADIAAETGPEDEGVSETSPPWPGDPDVEPDRLLDDEIDAVLEPRKARQRHDNRLALVAALMILVVLMGLVGWTGYRAAVSHRTQQERNLLLHALARRRFAPLTRYAAGDVFAPISRFFQRRQYHHDAGHATQAAATVSPRETPI